MTIIPPYSPDLAPCDFFLFPKMKLRLKGRRFDTIEEIQAESQEVLNTLTLQNFQGCME
jgi:transposase